jgi:hypothetical protein
LLAQLFGLVGSIVDRDPSFGLCDIVRTLFWPIVGGLILAYSWPIIFWHL